MRGKLSARVYAHALPEELLYGKVQQLGLAVADSWVSLLIQNKNSASNQLRHQTLCE